MSKTKIVHLYKRAPDSDVEAFQGALASEAGRLPRIEGLTGYVQSHTLLRGYAKGELLFDAVEEFTFADKAAAERFTNEFEPSLLASRSTIIDSAASHRMAVEVHRVKDHDVPVGAVKNIEFVNRRPGMELDAFRRYWREIHGPIGSKIESILRYEQNHLAMDSYNEATEPRFDGLAITWFASTAAMRAGADTESYRLTREDEANFLPDGHLPIIITNEVVVVPLP